MRFNSLLNLIGFSGKAHGKPPVSGCVTDTRMPETPAPSQGSFRPISAVTYPCQPPPPRFSRCSSARTTSGSCGQARSSPIAAPSERAPEATGVLERLLPEGFARPALTRNSLQPCNPRRRYAPRRYRLTPAERTGCVPYPRTSIRRDHGDPHR